MLCGGALLDEVAALRAELSSVKTSLASLTETVSKKADASAAPSVEDFASLQASVALRLDGQEAHIDAVDALANGLRQQLATTRSELAATKAELAATKSDLGVLQLTVGRRLDTLEGHSERLFKWVYKAGDRKFSRIEQQAANLQDDINGIRDAMRRKADVDEVPSMEEFRHLNELVQKKPPQVPFRVQLHDVAESLRKANADTNASVERLLQCVVRIRQDMDVATASFNAELRGKADAAAVPSKEEFQCVSDQAALSLAQAEAGRKAVGELSQQLEALGRIPDGRYPDALSQCVVRTRHEVHAVSTSFSTELRGTRDTVAAPSKEAFQPVSDQAAFSLAQAEANWEAVAKLWQQLEALKQTRGGKSTRDD